MTTSQYRSPMNISPAKLFRFSRKELIIFLLPLTVAALSIFLKNATGPYWLAANQDPSYQYLINSLMILDGKTPNLVDHPGTPLQLLGSALITIIKLGFLKENTIEDVINRPEYFLNTMHACLLLIFIITLMGISYYAFRKTRDFLFVTLLQLPALLFVVLPTNSYEQYTMTVLCNVSPEILLATVGNLFTACLLVLYFEMQYARNRLLVVVWGIVCGLGAATKMTFLPLWFLPVIVVPRVRDKLLVLLCSFSAFVIFTFPIISRYSDVFYWFRNIVIHTGGYGAGVPGFIPIDQLFGQLGRLVQDNMYFFLITAICIGFLFYRAGSRPIKSRRLKDDRRRPVWFLSAVTIVSVLQILMVVKHPASHYLLPAMGLSGFQMAMIYQSAGGSTRPMIKKCALAFVVVTIALYVVVSIHYQLHLNQTSRAAVAFSKKVFADYQACSIFSYCRSSSVEYALNFANEFDWMYPYSGVLGQKYPDSFFYSRGRNIFHGFQRQLSLEDLKRLQAAGRCLLLYGTPSDFVYGFLGVEEIDSAGKEKVYKIVSIPSSQAIGYFLMAKHFEGKKNFRAAYINALNAKRAGLTGMDNAINRLKLLAFSDPAKGH